MNLADARLAQAKYDAEQARTRLVSTAVELQRRIRPATLMGNAWDGVRDRSGELAGDAIQALKDRPVKASGVAAAVAVFLARRTLWSAVSRLWNHGEDEEFTTQNGDDDESRDRAGGTATRSRNKEQEHDDDA